MQQLTSPPAPLADSRVQRFVDTARGVLGAQSVTLTDARGLVVAGTGGHSDGYRCSFHDPAPLCAPIPLFECDSHEGEIQSVSVCGVSERTTVLTAEWTQCPRLTSGLGVSLRALAQLASVIAADGPVVDERIVEAGGRVLAELALTAESFEELVGGVTAVLAVLVDGTSAGVSIVNDRGFLQVLPGSFGASREVVSAALVDRAAVATSTAEVFRSGEKMISNNPEVEIPRYPLWFECFQVKRLITLPIIVGDERLGVVHVANRPLPFGEREAELAERVTPFIASAVAQVRQRMELRQREELVFVVGQAAAAIAAGLGVGDLAVHLDAFREVLSCSTIVVTDREDQQQTIIGDSDIGREIGFLSGIDAESAGLRSAMHRPERPGEFGWVSTQVPIIVDGEVRATLAMLRTRWIPFQRHERTAIRRMAETIALAWSTRLYLREQAESARIKERLRIADDIHDRAAQLIFAGRMTLQGAEELLAQDHPVHPRIRHALDLLNRTDMEVRDVIRQLSDDTAVASLRDRLHAAIAEVEQQFDIQVQVEPVRDVPMSSIDELQLNGMIEAGREAIVNAAKHAGKCTIRVSLTAPASGRLRLVVADDGVGIGTLQPGYGLTSTRRKLRDLSGSMLVKQRPGGGTVAIIEVAATSY